jgi:F0F1-type ATP synthase epsilon subunit
MLLTIISPEKKIAYEDVISITIDTDLGQRTILEKHINFISFFDITDVYINLNNGIEKVSVATGYVHIHNNKVVILSELIDIDRQKLDAKYKHIKESIMRQS